MCQYGLFQFQVISELLFCIRPFVCSFEPFRRSAAGFWKGTLVRSVRFVSIFTFVLFRKQRFMLRNTVSSTSVPALIKHRLEKRWKKSSFLRSFNSEHWYRPLVFFILFFKLSFNVIFHFCVVRVATFPIRYMAESFSFLIHLPWWQATSLTTL